jgi:UDP-2,3-diacylglucosamine hydrolase
MVFKRMSRIFFISDAHLGLEDEEKESHRVDLLLKFFNHVANCGRRLYIVGDLFDFWFEYQHVIPRRYFRILCALQNLVEQNIRVEYITGNHDFWMENFFEHDLGIRVHHQPLDMEYEGNRFYVAHGDGLAKSDVGYRALKKILRHRFNIHLYRLLHPDAGFRLALFCSQLSRNHREIKNRDEEYAQYAKDRFAEGFDGVVLAHTHRPQEIHENGRTYVNIGDWMQHYSYGRLEEGRLSLEYWPENSSTSS